MQKVLFEIDDDLKIKLKIMAAKSSKTTKDFLIWLIEKEAEKQGV